MHLLIWFQLKEALFVVGFVVSALIFLDLLNHISVNVFASFKLNIIVVFATILTKLLFFVYLHHLVACSFDYFPFVYSLCAFILWDLLVSFFDFYLLHVLFQLLARFFFFALFGVLFDASV